MFPTNAQCGKPTSGIELGLVISKEEDQGQGHCSRNKHFFSKTITTGGKLYHEGLGDTDGGINITISSLLYRPMATGLHLNRRDTTKKEAPRSHPMKRLS